MPRVGTTAIAGDWRQELTVARENSKLTVHGTLEAENESQARVAIALLEAYRSGPDGFLMMETYAATDATSPIDILLSHPSVGFLWIEVKGHGISDIVEVSSSSLFVRYGADGTTATNAYKQVQTTMHHAQRRITKATGKKPQSLFQFMVALPRIHNAEWKQRGFDSALDRNLLLLADDLSSPEALMERLARLTDWNMKHVKGSKPLCPNDVQAVRLHYGDSRLFATGELARPGINAVKFGAYLDKIEGTNRPTSTQLLKLLNVKVRNAPYLIRGVAGSGKTIALAGQVADYLARNAPSLSSKRVAVVCHNHSLVPMLHKKIERFWTTLYTGPMPWKSVTVCTGSMLWNKLTQRDADLLDVPRGREGLQLEKHLSQLENIRAKDAGRYENLLFDVMFVDEAQDFEPKELQLLLNLTRVNRVSGLRPTIVFYDDAQNISGQKRPKWTDLGFDFRGGRSTVMGHCRRCTREIVEFGFNVLLGKSSASRANTREFADIADLKERKLVFEHDKFVEVRFTEDHGPDPIIEHFATREEELLWIAEEISLLVHDHSVRPEQIAVLYMKDLKKNNLTLRQLLQLVKDRIPSDTLHGFVHSFDDNFRRAFQFKRNHITVGKVSWLKGYEAPVVFLMAADTFGADPRGRASFYVGATRDKQLLYVSGVRSAIDPSLLEESLDVQRSMRLLNFSDRVN